MYGKIVGTLICGTVAMMFAWHIGFVVAFSLLGAVVGHLMVDHDPGVVRTKPVSVDEVFSEAPRARGMRRRATKTHRPIKVTRTQPAHAPQRSAPTPEEALAQALCPLFIEVARIDGPVVQAEVRVVREYFQEQLHFGAAGSEAVRLALKDALSRPPGDFAAVVQTAVAALKPTQRLEAIRALYELAHADGDQKKSESDALKQVVQHFEIGEDELLEITRSFFGSGDVHYELLGVEEAATDDEIRSAFRKLAAENHPDRVASLGPAEAAAASERFREIKEAYEALRKLRGF